MKQQIEIPISALMLSTKDRNGASVGGGGGVRILAYSGKPIRSHWYWGDLAIDLRGIVFSHAKYPILENHRQDRKVGYFTKDDIRVNKGGQVSF
jgi:hypothetical protein